MKYIEFDESRPMDLVLLGRVAIDFNPAYNDQVVAAAGQGSREYVGKPISKALEDAITERSSVFANGNDRSRIPVTQEQREPLYSQIMQPIISAGDTIGSVLLLGKNERDVMGESEKMLIRTASGFLGRQMEQ